MVFGLCCGCDHDQYYYYNPPSPPPGFSFTPYVGSCASGVCADSTFAKAWQFSWSPTWWAGSSDAECCNEQYPGTFTLHQRTSPFPNPCAFDSDERAIRWVNAGLPDPDYCEETTLPRYTFLIQPTGLSASHPGTNFVLYIRWIENHSGTDYTMYQYFSANKPTGTTQNCLAPIEVTYPSLQRAPTSSPSSPPSNVAIIQQPGSVVTSIILSPVP